jgi:hypothetical protein
LENGGLKIVNSFQFPPKGGAGKIPGKMARGEARGEARPELRKLIIKKINDIN